MIAVLVSITLLINSAFGFSDHSTLCVPMQKVFSMDQECSKFSNLLDKMQCVVVRNRFEELKIQQDEFNSVKLINAEIIVYSLNGKLYKTKCENIESIEFPQMVENCTRDLPVTYLKNGLKQFGFANKQGIIREKSIPAECTDDIEVYNIQDKQIIKYKDMVTINDEEPEETTPLNFVERDFSIFDSSTRLETMGILLLLFIAYLIKLIINKLKQNRTAIQMNKQAQPTTQPNINLQNLQNGLGMLAAAAESLNNLNSLKQSNPFQCQYCKVILKSKAGLTNHQKKCKEQSRRQSCFCF